VTGRRRALVSREDTAVALYSPQKLKGGSRAHREAWMVIRQEQTIEAFSLKGGP
jgi:hypothetical protein